MKKITILLPAYNEAESFDDIKNCMQQVVSDNPDYDWEFLLINDGSTDQTLQQMKELHQQDDRYHYIDLSRNYGKEIAIMAGIDHVQGDAIIIMDADMQHPVSVIPEMLRYWEEGYDDVYAQRKSSDESWLKRQTSKLYYRILQKSTNIAIQKDTGDFRLLDRKCIDALKQMRETDRNNKGMFSWIGFKKIGISYQQNQRQHGKTKWSYYKLLNLALTGILYLWYVGILHGIPLSDIYRYQNSHLWRSCSGLPHPHGHHPLPWRHPAHRPGHHWRIPQPHLQRDQETSRIFCKRI